MEHAPIRRVRKTKGNLMIAEGNYGMASVLASKKGQAEVYSLGNETKTVSRSSSISPHDAVEVREQYGQKTAQGGDKISSTHERNFIGSPHPIADVCSCRPSGINHTQAEVEETVSHSRNGKGEWSFENEERNQCVDLGIKAHHERVYEKGRVNHRVQHITKIKGNHTRLLLHHPRTHLMMWRTPKREGSYQAFLPHLANNCLHTNPQRGTHLKTHTLSLSHGDAVARATVELRQGERPPERKEGKASLFLRSTRLHENKTANR